MKHDNKKQRINKTAIAGLVGAVILAQPIAQLAGCGKYEPKLEDIPQVQAVNEFGEPYITEKERAARDLQMEKEDYTSMRQKTYKITVLQGDTLEGLAKEMYGYKDMWRNVFDTNNVNDRAITYPGVIGEDPDRYKQDCIFTDKSSPHKIYPGQRINVYFSKPEDALAYAKKHPERKVESVGLRDLKSSLENFFWKK